VADGNLIRGASPLGLPHIRLRAKRYGETSPKRLRREGGRVAHSLIARSRCRHLFTEPIWVNETASSLRTHDIKTLVSRRRPLALQLAGLGAMCGSLCACGGAMSEPPPRILNDKVIAAVKANDVEAVRTLLQQGAPVNARGSGEGSDEGYTALLYAVDQHFLPLTQLLLRSGADPTLPAGTQNVFPLLKAARAGERDMLVLLLDYGANINQKRPGDGMDALAVACLEGHLAIVDMLVARNAAVEPQDLSYAIGAGHVEVAKRLLDAGADPAWTFNGRTMTQVARESPDKTRGDLGALLQRYAARQNR
jgi:ankyrin repeat protein